VLEPFGSHQPIDTRVIVRARAGLGLILVCIAASCGTQSVPGISKKDLSDEMPGIYTESHPCPALITGHPVTVSASFVGGRNFHISWYIDGTIDEHDKIINVRIVATSFHPAGTQSTLDFTPRLAGESIWAEAINNTDAGYTLEDWIIGHDSSCQVSDSGLSTG
jgi:hypothetical protein